MWLSPSELPFICPNLNYREINGDNRNKNTIIQSYKKIKLNQY